MSAVLEAAPPAVSTEPRQTWAAVFALARFEARELLLRVPVLLAFAVYIAWTVYRDGDDFPVLQSVDRATQSAPLLVALAVLLSANLAVLRSRRRDTERHFAVLLLQPWQRTAAHALSVVPAAVLTALCVAGQFTWQALKPGAIGHGSPAELLVGPLTVLLFGAVGVLLGRLIPSVVAAPLAGVFVLFFFLLVAAPGDNGGTRWLAPVIGEASNTMLPSDLIGRPAAWHALYLAGLVLVAVLLAMLVSGGRTPIVAGALAAAVVLTLTGAVRQAEGVSPELTAARERISVTPEKEQTCVRHDGSAYCAFPEWEPQTGTWADVVDHVRSLAAGNEQKQQLLVRQRVDARYGLSGDAALDPSATPHQVTVGTAWGGNRVPEFSAAVASVLVTGSEKAAGDMCDGRMVTVMWLALGWADDPMQSFRNVRLDDSVTGSAIVLSPTDPLSMTSGQTDVVRELLQQPRDTVTAKVKANWAELTSPKAKTSRAAELLGVKVPKDADACEE
ncbi:ABC transporter permease [Streptomyces sp. GESEQ-35]|uniref:ABC transporter permease n=1 Tax=Streptomyces sp. GESEQ-35 TaxID=2812657 RepID=UPI001B31EDF4|nr:ABC transporter permease [Streptomyces sp. GESEQ-35]